VHFTDSHPGFATVTQTPFDSVRDAPLIQDATLDNFFSRPIKVLSAQWGTGLGLYQQFNPWAAFFQQQTVLDRLNNYKLMRANLHLKFTINGNAFHYGRAMAIYRPLPNFDDMTIQRQLLDIDLVAASQRPHIFLDPTNSQGGEMVLPFFWHQNLFNIVAQDWKEMGEITITSLQELKHANGATDSVTVNVFAWATDVKFAIPTNIQTGSIAPGFAVEDLSPKSDPILPHANEYAQGPVSKPASIVANIASRLKTAPVIGPFARATEIGAQATAAMSTLFGYSKPPMLQSSMYRPLPKNNIATTSGLDDTVKLTFDPKQELSIDPRTVGLTDKDELTITSIATRESYLTQFDWPVGSAPSESILWNCIVDPAIYRVLNKEIHMPACCFAALPFNYWRGTMKFRFQVVCSKYHKGRLKIVYDPEGTHPDGDSDYNTAYTTIVDISDQTDFTIECGWGQPTTFRRRLGITDDPLFVQFRQDPLTYYSTALTTGNGTIAVYVVNELTVPRTENNDISINVFVSMGDDFEVAQPDGYMVDFLRLRPEPTPPRLSTPEDEPIRPHAGENPAEEKDRVDSQPVHPPSINTMSAYADDDKADLVHFGERVSSFRQILKRYNVHEYMPTFGINENLSDNDYIVRKARTAMPFEPGYVNEYNNIALETEAGYYVYSHMPLMRYLSTAFAGWRGSIRWMADFSMAGPEVIGPQASRAGSPWKNFNGIDALAPRNTPAGAGTLLYFKRSSNGKEGTSLTNVQVNPVLAFELPFYSQYRFAHPRLLSPFDNGIPSDDQIVGPGFEMDFVARYEETGTTNNNGIITTWVSAGEDFNLFYYMGPPIFYIEQIPPLDPPTPPERDTAPRFPSHTL
jgi:hypothetical protein